MAARVINREKLWAEKWNERINYSPGLFAPDLLVLFPPYALFIITTLKGMGIIHRGTRYPYAILLNGFLSLFLFSRLAIHPCSLIFNYSSNVRHSFSKIVDSKVKLIYPDWLAKRVRKVKDTISPISSFYNSFRLLIVTQVTICFDSNFLSCARNFIESYERKKKKDHH